MEGKRKDEETTYVRRALLDVATSRCLSCVKSQDWTPSSRKLRDHGVQVVDDRILFGATCARKHIGEPVCAVRPLIMGGRGT
jgi:hypothetical protein